MSTAIYYFTGTGNSLKISSDLAARLEDAQIIPMTEALKTGTLSASETIGLVFPVYMFGIPRIVAEFVKKLSGQMKGKYLFSVAVNGGTVAGSLPELSQKLSAKGLHLSAGFSVLTPSNFIVEFIIGEEEIQRIFETSAEKLDQIASVVKRKETCELEQGSRKDRIIKTGMIHKVFSPFIPIMDITFRKSDACNGCGICTRVCPVGNIKLEKGSPKWQHHCQQCFACINNCPKQSINYLNLTVGKKRYHNPFIPLNDLLQRPDHLSV